MDLYAMDTLHMLANCILSQNKQDERKCTSYEKLLHIFEYYGCKEVYQDKEHCYA
jgi:endonuclease III